MSRGSLTWDTLPAFATDAEIGEVVLGRDRRREFRGLSELHEPAGMPKIDPARGGRPVPAVRAYLDSRHGLALAAPLAPKGKKETSMSQDDRPQGPGLKWRDRRHGAPVPYWFANRKAVKAGYPVKSANLSEFADRPRELEARCERLETEMRLWLTGAPPVKPEFNGTFGSLITIYETDPESKFHT